MCTFFLYTRPPPTRLLSGWLVHPQLSVHPLCVCCCCVPAVQQEEGPAEEAELDDETWAKNVTAGAWVVQDAWALRPCARSARVCSQQWADFI